MRLFKQGDNHDVRFSGCGRTLSGWKLRGDWLLVGDQKTPVGFAQTDPSFSARQRAGASLGAAALGPCSGDISIRHAPGKRCRASPCDVRSKLTVTEMEAILYAVF